jgi:hypothetical protein
MRTSTPGRLTKIAWLLAAIGTMGAADEVTAAAITLSGTVTYDGAYTGDSLYVAALDSTGAKDVTILDVQVIAVGPLPTFSEAYSLTRIIHETP